MFKAGVAFSRAANCAAQAQAPQDDEANVLQPVADSWMRAASNYQIAELLAADAALPRQPG